MGSLAAIPGRSLAGAERQVEWPADAGNVFTRMARHRGCAWLDSAGGPAPLARWSVMTAEPSAVLITRGGTTRLAAPGGAVLEESRRNPFEVLREVLAACRFSGGDEPALPFGPGFYGYLSYDLAPYVELTAALPPTADIPLPDLWFGLYDSVLVLDHAARKAFVVGGRGPACDAIHEALAASTDRAADRELNVDNVSCNMTPAEFRGAVARAREYIAAGDIYQVNLSRRYTVSLAPEEKREGAGLRWAGLYRRLRQANPAPYAAYLDVGEAAVLSSSPELFLDLRGGRVVTRPIKGTRPLEPQDEAFNRRMREELLASEKDRAELVMIVDLERNDLGRVAAYGSVRVTEPRTVEAYAAVYHTVATVEGRLHQGRDVADLLKATFPGGSITGAPKVRAMQIIAELEPTRRSVYTGAVGYLRPPSESEPAGGCALNIAIRTLLAAGDAVHIQVGGGIVADSDPEAEFQETSHKARAMLAALGLSP
ncbi:MAG: aminodeoxychorismate synthase component I [Planctomycetes bacterium]|nr:aminodeoxychorismate synthase component I [Planctomycetota bacterium]